MDAANLNRICARLFPFSSHSVDRMKRYLIHDNRGRPFRVEIDGKTVDVYKKSQTDDPENDEQYSKHIQTFKAENIYIGKSSGKKNIHDHTPAQARQFDGNSILLHIKGDEYVYIGHEIYAFHMFDDFKKYYSPVGNNDVPYPHVLGSEYVYLLLDKEYVERARFPEKQDWEDVYIPFHGTFSPKKGWVSEIREFAKKMKTRLIHKRIW
jgi:hypothetical protein